MAAEQQADVAAGIVQVAGAIGVDPAFNPTLSADPTTEATISLRLNLLPVTGSIRDAVLARATAK